MPVRIYAFAKELGLDNKQLLEICEKANIKGKGSALASLEDDEIAIVKGFMSGGEVEKTEPKPDVAAPMRPVRPVASKKKIGEIVSPVSVAPPAVEEEVEVEAQEVVEEVVETPETPEPAETPEEPVRPAKRGGLLDRIRGVKPKPEEVPEKPRVSAKAKVVEPKAPATVAPTVKPPLMPRRQPGVAPRRQLKNLDQRGNAKGEAAKKDTPKKKPAGANVRSIKRIQTRVILTLMMG